MKPIRPSECKHTTGLAQLQHMHVGHLQLAMTTAGGFFQAVRSACLMAGEYKQFSFSADIIEK